MKNLKIKKKKTSKMKNRRVSVRRLRIVMNNINRDLREVLKELNMIHLLEELSDE